MNPEHRKLTRPTLHFSGPNSVDMWDDIGNVKSDKSREAAYSIAVQCQKLEEVVSALENRIADLERGK